MTGPNWSLSDDRKMISIDFPTDPPCRVTLEAAQVDDLLHNLGLLRASMTDQHPAEFALGQKTMAVPDPRWATEPDLLNGDSLIHLRHPGFGWLHFLIPRTDAAKLAGYLQAQVEQPANAPPAKKN